MATLQEIWYREDYNIIASAMPFIRWPKNDGDDDGDGEQQLWLTDKMLSLNINIEFSFNLALIIIMLTITMIMTKYPDFWPYEIFLQPLWEHQPWLHLLPASPGMLWTHHFVKASHNWGLHHMIWWPWWWWWWWWWPWWWWWWWSWLWWWWSWWQFRCDWSRSHTEAAFGDLTERSLSGKGSVWLGFESSCFFFFSKI